LPEALNDINRILNSQRRALRREYVKQVGNKLVVGNNTAWSKRWAFERRQNLLGLDPVSYYFSVVIGRHHRLFAFC
jgi:hypothetical protein